MIKLSDMKSEKAKKWLTNWQELDQELTYLDVVYCINLAETELTEQHKKESAMSKAIHQEALKLTIQKHKAEITELISERDKYKALYENNESAVETCRIAVERFQVIKHRAVETFKDTIFGEFPDCKQKNLINEFTEKLNQE